MHSRSELLDFGVLGFPQFLHVLQFADILGEHALQNAVLVHIDLFVLVAIEQFPHINFLTFIQILFVLSENFIDVFVLSFQVIQLRFLPPLHLMLFKVVAVFRGVNNLRALVL